MTNARGQQGRFTGRSPGGPRRVYLIEEDPVERVRVVALLEQAGYEVTVVPSLEAAFTQGFWSGDPTQLLFVGRRGQDG